MQRWIIGLLVAVACLAPPAGAQASYSDLFVFGDSLSDSGNNAIALGPLVTPVPIPGNTFIPTFPYASGRYTNGAVWAEMFAADLGLSAAPVLAGGTDFAFGGARTGPLDFHILPPTLADQTAAFLIRTGGIAPGDALYVVAGGGNDARDALDAIIGGAGVGPTVAQAAARYAATVAGIVGALERAGARDLVVWDAPDIGKTPDVRAQGSSTMGLGTLVASAMNRALRGALAGDPAVTLFDDFGLMDGVIADPGAFGLTNVTDACAQFVTCDPSQYLFWDGIHPTSAGHEILAEAMLRTVVPEPSALLLLGLGFAEAVGVAWRRQSRWPR